MEKTCSLSSHVNTLAPSAAVSEILKHLISLSDPKNVTGMSRFAIRAARVLGISVTNLRAIARAIGRNHQVAELLVESGIYEARILAAFVAEPKKLTRKQADEWVKTAECWADCDGFCIHLFRKTLFSHELAKAWILTKPELVKRAGFTMIATLAVHDKSAPDEVFENYLSLIKTGADDERHNVRKSVNWALRQIGKRNQNLFATALKVARLIQDKGTASSRWIASDALREFKQIADRRGWAEQ